MEKGEGTHKQGTRPDPLSRRRRRANQGSDGEEENTSKGAEGGGESATRAE